MMRPFIFDEIRAINHLLDLLAIEGTSGQEENVAKAVRQKLIDGGCNPDYIVYDDAAKKIPGEFSIGNLIVKLPGTVDKARYLFIGHLDTVPLCRGAVPKRLGDRIFAYGETALGADNRTAVACLVSLIETILHQELPHPPLTVLFTVGEEVGLRGAHAVTLKSLGNPEMGFNIDSGKPDELIIGAVGADRWEIHIHGLSSHAGVHPEDGVSALLIASQAITEVAKNGYFGKIEVNDKKGTANIGIINGGEVTNQVTDYVYIKGESRSFDLDFLEKINQVYHTMFKKCAQRVKNRKGKSGTIKFQSQRDYQPFFLSKTSKVVDYSIRKAKILGLNPKLIRANGGLDANALNTKGIPTITFGAGQHNAHTLEEYVNIGEFLEGCRLAIALATTID